MQLLFRLIFRVLLTISALALVACSLFFLAKFLLMLLFSATAIQLFMGASAIASFITAFKFKRPFSAFAIIGAASLLAASSSLLATAAAYPAEFALACYSALIIGGCSLLHLLASYSAPRRANRFRQGSPVVFFEATRNRTRRHLSPYTVVFPTPPTYTPRSTHAKESTSLAITETLTPIETFQSRLQAIKYTGDIQEDFYDPISFTLMENPINAITEIHNHDGTIQQVDYILDQSTYNDLRVLPCGQREQPANRLPILRCVPCNDLKASIDMIITQLENEYHLTPQQGATVRASV